MQLQRELDSLRPIDYDELIEAVDLLQNFRVYWDQCSLVDDPLEARKQLVAKIVNRVFVYDDKIMAIVLHGDFAVVLGKNKTAPSEIESAVYAHLSETSIISVEISSQFGDRAIASNLSE